VARDRRMNDIVAVAWRGNGVGRSLGPRDSGRELSPQGTSVLAPAVGYGFRPAISVSGLRLLHEHPNFDPASFGVADVSRLLTLCDTVSDWWGRVPLLRHSMMGPGY